MGIENSRSSSEVLGQRPELSLVIPTKNEMNNIHPLMDSLHQNLTGISSQIIFVDDSTDRTADIIRTYPSEIPVFVIKRPAEEQRGGLAGALVKGFGIASGDIIGVMDADLQHSPELLPILYRYAQNHDIVIASRYIEGAKSEGLKTPYRRIVSVGTIKAAQLVFPKLRKIKDTNSGFFLIRRSLIENTHLSPYGFKILLELLVRTEWNSVIEIPYEFQPRLKEKSKANFLQGLTYYYHLYLLFRDELAGKIPR